MKFIQQQRNNKLASWKQCHEILGAPNCITETAASGIGSQTQMNSTALTSHMMKTMERLLLHILRPQVCHALDPLQFAYEEKVGVDDAITNLLHRTHSHLDKGKSVVRRRVFLIPFNPSDWETNSCRWVLTLTLYPGLQPVLFVHVWLLLQHRVMPHAEVYRSLVEDFVQWCKLNHLQLNTANTKEIVVDFRRSKPALLPVSIEGVNVDMVKNLGNTPGQQTRLVSQH